MKDKTVFDVIGTELSKAEIPFVIIGGFAVNHYQETRVTADIDILMLKEDFQKALPLLEEEGYKLAVSENLFARFVGDNRYIVDLIIFLVNQEIFTRIWSEAREIEIKGAKIKIPSFRCLMELKLDYPPPKVLSMDDYLKFIELYRECFSEQDNNEHWKKRRVNVPFVLK